MRSFLHLSLFDIVNLSNMLYTEAPAGGIL